MHENKTESANYGPGAVNDPDQTEIEWLDGNIPRSPRFDDTYYARSDGLAESRFVFLGGNRLPQRWSEMSHTVIAELGFGTGLNFLATLIAWRETAPANATLTFISFERYPLSATVMAKALERWPELREPAARLVLLWRQSAGAIRRIDWSQDVRLEIHIGDAATLLPAADFAADAWYLDGFSPATNPDLWSAPLLGAVYRQTLPGGSFATYSAAGWVRRNLAAAGFAVTRQTGFAGKREMLTGVKPPPA